MRPHCVTANSTALRFNTGNAPGSPRHTGQTCELGGAPKAVEQAQKILLLVRSCACTSSPMTGSQSFSALEPAVASEAIVSVTF